jgi:hypothetical protein
VAHALECVDVIVELLSWPTGLANVTCMTQGSSGMCHVHVTIGVWRENPVRVSYSGAELSSSSVPHEDVNGDRNVK